MNTNTKELTPVINQFMIKAPVSEVLPLGNGLINDTYIVSLEGFEIPCTGIHLCCYFSLGLGNFLDPFCSLSVPVYASSTVSY